VVLGSFGGLLPTGSRVVDADFTLCRAETQYSDLRHPDTVTPATLDVDLSRRDFTMNAMAVGENGQWHDPYNGWDDAEDHVLKTVGHPQDRFTEDPLRMLRALRFAIKYNLRFNATLAAVLDDRRLLRGIETLPAERVREELNKAFSADSYRTMYYLMTRFPELGAAVATYHPNLKLKVVQEGM
jgi:tRNA nucleotidyltransferase/poly(A) polymerase